MLRALVISILAVGTAFAFLSVAIVTNKAVREIRDGWRRLRRARLEPKVLAYAHGDDASLLPALGGRVPLLDRGVLESILLDHVHRVRGIERDRLGRVLDELGYVDRYLRRLKSPRWWARADAAERLGLAGAGRASAALIAAMEDSVPEVRLRAAKALAAAGGASAVLPLVATLREPNRWSTIRIADVLSGLGPKVQGELQTAYAGLNLAGKLAVLDILGRIRSIEAEPWLSRRLDDPEADVRARACHALGSVGDPAAAPRLRGRLADGAWPVRAMAAKALGRLRDAASVRELRAALRDREWWVRANAAEALRQIGPAGLAEIEAALDDDDRYARHQAVLVLQASGRLDELVDTLAREGPGRNDAERKLRIAAHDGQVGRLEELAASHRDPEVRRVLTAIVAEAPHPEAAA